MSRNLILFDIDGTILNLENGIAYDIFVSTINDVFSTDLNSSNLPSFHGKTDLHILEDIGLELGIHADDMNERLPLLWDGFFEKFVQRITKQSIEVLPGVSELINLFHNESDYSLGLVTGNFERNAYLKLKTANLDSYFTIGAFGDDHKNRNLLPSIALERAKNAGLVHSDIRSERVLIIGDTFRDVDCARANGMSVVSVATGCASYDELYALKPDFLFDDLSKFENVFDTINNYLEKI